MDLINNVSTGEELIEKVKSSYSKIAIDLQLKNFSPCCGSSNEITGGSGCCITQETDVPSLGSSNNLLEFANPKQGEIIVDLGSGPGNDALNSANAVGVEGKVYGIDFLDEMIKFSRKNAIDKNINNVMFVQGEITDIPLENELADLVISNCVINLVQNKSEVFDSAFRVLKPGGRIVFSDIILKSHEDKSKLSDEDYCGCIGGGDSESSYLSALTNSGFKNVEVIRQSTHSITKDNSNIIYYSSIFKAIK